MIELVFLLIPLTTIALIFLKSRESDNKKVNLLLIINSIIFLFPLTAALLGGNNYSAAPWAYMFLFPICVIIHIIVAIVIISRFIIYKLNFKLRNSKNFKNKSVGRPIFMRLSLIPLFLGIISILIGVLTMQGMVAIIIGLIAYILSTIGLRIYHVNPQIYNLHSYKTLRASKIIGIIGVIYFPIKIILSIN